MNFVPVSDISPQEVNDFFSDLRDWQDLLDHTCVLYRLENETDPMAFIGFMQECVLDNSYYVWIATRIGYQYTRTQLKAGRESFRKFINERPGCAYAEASSLADMDNHFLRFCGFRKTSVVEDRNVYQWSR